MRAIISFLLCIGFYFSDAQKSLLINFGGSSCTPSYLPSFSMIKDPLSSTPALISNCDLQAQMPNYFAVFVAYNPENNKVYIADIRSGIETKIWVMDVGLPGSIGCPASIPVAPTYSYGYVSNNFEFDNNGDLWSFSNYNPTTGQCSLDKFDVNTGVVINTRILQFPAGNFPNTITSGDLCILPNGRMFAVLGSPSQLYEITNYSGSSAATGTFLSYVPKDCYGIAYLNGVLEMAGNNFDQNCYYFDYDISTGVLGTEKPFQAGNSPIDNTSISPSVGCTKRLLSATEINSNTYDLSYEIYVRNMGNVILNNLSVQDNLANTFGAANVSNVSASFVAAGNYAGLTLNPSYNGTTNPLLLNPNQNLPNKINNNNNYFVKIQVNCRVTNIAEGTTYFNSANCKADIGGNSLIAQVIVTDTSNNGSETSIDPNQDGNPNEVMENLPTPFAIGSLPVQFINLTAKKMADLTALIEWQVATPTTGASRFEVEFSQNSKDWKTLGTIQIQNDLQSNYQYVHNPLPAGKLYYRIKETDADGRFVRSKIVLLLNGADAPEYHIFPNPADQQITVREKGSKSTLKEIVLTDMAGKRILTGEFSESEMTIQTAQLPDGTYLLKIKNLYNTVVKKIVVRH